MYMTLQHTYICHLKEGLLILRAIVISNHPSILLPPRPLPTSPTGALPHTSHYMSICTAPVRGRNTILPSSEFVHPALPLTKELQPPDNVATKLGVAGQLRRGGCPHVFRSFRSDLHVRSDLL